MLNQSQDTCRKINKVAVIILAAGLGTRMRSKKAKVLHELMGRAMILYVVETAIQVTGENIILVVGHQADTVQSIVSAHATVQYAFQKEQLGTGHAVQIALPFLDDQTRHVVILCGDVPLLSTDTIHALVDDHIEKDRDITLLAVDLENPSGYGRLILDGNQNLIKIVEEADATAEQKKIKTVNAGIYCVKRETLITTIHQLRPTNRQQELYLTDIVEIGNNHQKTVGVRFGNDPDEISGINTIDDLCAAECVLKSRMMKKS
jgi:UDP-N-acetylglucosamine diphosphorylase/glucosamine-1-phosphate N-acetyltransferase